MNKLNYASFEASQRLVDAGIALETEKHWILLSTGRWDIVDGAETVLMNRENIPAPSMAEVWRELPESIEWNDSWHHLTVEKLGDKTSCYYRTNGKDCDNTNPTDALIDLLIYVTGLKGHFLAGYCDVYNGVKP